jgi:hypothetical protein
MSKNEREDTTSFQTILYCAAALDLARNSLHKNARQGDFQAKYRRKSSLYSFVVKRGFKPSYI